MFIQQLDTNLHREEIRNNIIDQYNTKDEEDYPNPLESENKWKEWDSNFINYLFTLIGVNGISLSHVVQENDKPDANGDSPNFMDKMITCAPLMGD